MSGLTDRQLEIYEFMRDYQRTNGMPATTREICDAFGFASTNAAADHLKLMQRKGVVTHRPKLSRGWRAV